MQMVLSHGNELFGARWVNGNDAVKIGFGCAHFHGDPKSLDHFVNGVTDAVQSNHFFVVARANQFHAARLTV